MTALRKLEVLAGESQSHWSASSTIWSKQLDTVRNRADTALECFAIFNQPRSAQVGKFLMLLCYFSCACWITCSTLRWRFGESEKNRDNSFSVPITFFAWKTSCMLSQHKDWRQREEQWKYRALLFSWQILGWPPLSFSASVCLPCLQDHHSNDLWSCFESCQSGTPLFFLFFFCWSFSCDGETQTGIVVWDH